MVGRDVTDVDVPGWVLGSWCIGNVYEDDPLERFNDGNLGTCVRSWILKQLGETFSDRLDDRPASSLRQVDNATLQQSVSQQACSCTAVETNVQVMEEGGVCTGKALDSLLVIRRIWVVYIGQNRIKDVWGN